MGNLRNTILEIFVKEIGLDPGEFTDTLAYNSVPEWDSQAHLLIVMAIEEKFDVTLESDEVVKMTSVRKILDLLQSRGIHDSL